MSNPTSDRDRGDVNYRRGTSPPRSGNFNNNNNNYRGANRGGRGGGRGTGYRPRRYWDNDELYRRERDYDDRGRDRERRRGRRSRSYTRSPSLSRSRSRSDSRSRSRSRTPDKSPKRGTDEYQPKRGAEEYQPKSVPGSTSNTTSQQQYEPAYIPQKSNVIGQQQSAAERLYVPQSQQHTNGQSIHYSETSRHDYPPPPAPPVQNVQNYKKQQHEVPMMMGPEPGYYGASVPPNFSAQVNEYGSFTQNITYVPTGLNSQQQNPTSSSTPTESKGKGKEKKKKKRRQRSSSSSSSSSSTSSDSDSKGKRKSRRSGSSGSSSEEDRKEKSKKAGKGVTADQKKALIAQKDNYSAKLQLLENNIRLLMQKEYELRDTNADPSLIEENKKLQNEIRARCHAVQTVLDKINDILQPGSNETKPSCPPPPPIISQKVSQPQQQQQVQLVVQQQVAPRKRVEQYDFYDNGEHWCRLCNVFPATIQDMLDHFHSKDHHAQVEQLGIEEKPWRKQRPYQENAVAPGAKKVPFKGMQFFSPVQGWYCRICNIYMGDHEGAIEHLKCEDHTENYLNFLDEHRDWEEKWSTDRQKARGRAGFQNQEAHSRSTSHGRSGRDVEDVEDAKSIRIQMRNMVKADENRSALPFTTKTEQQSKVDAVVDEWMGKPQKVKLDIDTQKFAEIVRQKHGQKEKEMLAAKHSESSKSAPPPPPILREKEQDKSRSSRERDQSSRKSGGNDSSSRRGNTVEMNLSNARDRERNRYSGSRGGRRRSKSRSRSRGRDGSRERHRRKSSRSRSRSPAPPPRHRDNNNKDIDNKERERVKPKEKEKPVTPEVKETVKKLPIIGKMPLYKKPIISSLTKDKIKSQEEDAAAVAAQLKKLAESKRNSEAVESMIQSLVRDSPKNITALKAQVVFPTSTSLQDSKFSVPMPSTIMTAFPPPSSTPMITPQPGMNMHAFTMADGNKSSGSYGGFHDGMSMYTHSFDAVTVKAPVMEEMILPKLIRREPEIPMPSHPMMMMNPNSNGSGGGLPDDLQQALDIIYSAPPPPEKIARDRFGPGRFGSGPPPGFEFPPNNYGSYHSHHQHHHHPKPHIPTSVPPPPKPVAPSSFEAIAPYGSNVYEELDDRPPGEDDGPPGVNNVPLAPPPKIVPPPIIETKKPPPQETPVFKPPPIDDDIEDLRMLGIDVDDAAAAAIR